MLVGKAYECCEQLHGKGFLLKQKWAVYKCYIRPAIQHGSEAQYMKVRWEFYKGQRDPR